MNPLTGNTVTSLQPARTKNASHVRCNNTPHTRILFATSRFPSIPYKTRFLCRPTCFSAQFPTTAGEILVLNTHGITCLCCFRGNLTTRQGHSKVNGCNNTGLLIQKHRKGPHPSNKGRKAPQARHLMSICRKVYPLVLLLCLHHGSSYSTHVFSFKASQPRDVTYSSGRSAASLADITYPPRRLTQQLTTTDSHLSFPFSSWQALQDAWYQQDGWLERFYANRPPPISRKAACRDWYLVRNCDPRDDTSYTNKPRLGTRRMTNSKIPSPTPTLLAAPGNVISSQPRSLSQFSDSSGLFRVAKKPNFPPWDTAESQSEPDFNQKSLDHDKNFNEGNHVAPTETDEDNFESVDEFPRTQPIAEAFPEQEVLNARLYVSEIKKRDGKRIPRGWGPYSVLYINRPPQNDISYKSDTTPVPTLPPEVNVPRSSPLKASRQLRESVAEPKMPAFSPPRPPRPEGLRIITLPHLHATYGWGAFGQ